MGKSESEKGCKRHPNHNYLPGVCPECLRERLRQFHESSNSNTITAIDSFSSSEIFFAAASPRQRRHRRCESELVKATQFIGDKLMKSGSIGFEGRCNRASAGGAKKKGGFWVKLLRPKTSYFHSHPKVSREVLG